MCEDTKNKSDKDCTDKINQLKKKKRKLIMYIEITHESFNINNINKNAQL